MRCILFDLSEFKYANGWKDNVCDSVKEDTVSMEPSKAEEGNVWSDTQWCLRVAPC